MFISEEKKSFIAGGLSATFVLITDEHHLLALVVAVKNNDGQGLTAERLLLAEADIIRVEERITLHLNTLRMNLRGDIRRGQHHGQHKLLGEIDIRRLALMAHGGGHAEELAELLLRAYLRTYRNLLVVLEEVVSSHFKRYRAVVNGSGNGLATCENGCAEQQRQYRKNVPFHTLIIIWSTYL